MATLIQLRIDGTTDLGDWGNIPRQNVRNAHAALVHERLCAAYPGAIIAVETHESLRQFAIDSNMEDTSEVEDIVREIEIHAWNALRTDAAIQERFGVAVSVPTGIPTDHHHDVAYSAIESAVEALKTLGLTRGAALAMMRQAIDVYADTAEDDA